MQLTPHSIDGLANYVLSFSTTMECCASTLSDYSIIIFSFTILGDPHCMLLSSTCVGTHLFIEGPFIVYTRLLLCLYSMLFIKLRHMGYISTEGFLFTEKARQF